MEKEVAGDRAARMKPVGVVGESDEALGWGGLEPSQHLCPHAGPQAPDTTAASRSSRSAHRLPAAVFPVGLGGGSWVPGGGGGRTTSPPWLNVSQTGVQSSPPPFN